MENSGLQPDRPRSSGRAGPSIPARSDLPYLLLGQHIRNHRLQLRQQGTDRPWSQEDLAVAIGTDKAHVNRIECGRQFPTLDTLGRICDALDLAWPARRRLLGCAGLLKDLPEPRQDDMEKIEAVVTRALGNATHPVCLLDQDERIWDVNNSFAVVFLGYSARSKCLAEISGHFLLELLCESHSAHAYLRRTLVNFDQFALRLLSNLRHALQRRPKATQYQALLNDVLADSHLCSLWLQISAHLKRNLVPEYLDHQRIEVGASPIGPYSGDLWHSTFQADERFRVLHIMPASDDARRRFASLAGRPVREKDSTGDEPPQIRLLAGTAEFPSRPIRLHVPWASGGVTDVGARILAPLLQTVLGQPVNVVNCDNEQSAESLDSLSRLPADGHELVFINEPVLACLGGPVPRVLSHAASRPNLAVFDKLALHAYDPFGVYVRSESRYSSLRDMIKEAAAAPGKVIVGTSGPGTPAHLAALILEEATGVRFTFRHFTGSLEHIARFLSGETDVACLGSGVSLPAVKASEMRVLVSLTPRRFELMPEVPTLAEVGLSGPALASHRYVCLPRCVPEPIRARLMAGLNDALSTREHIERMRLVGLLPGNA